MREKLIADLRLIAAWNTPGGPTPNDRCPDMMNTCLAAADVLAAASRPSEPVALRSAVLDAILHERCVDPQDSEDSAYDSGIEDAYRAAQRVFDEAARTAS